MADRLIFQLGTNNWQRDGEFAPGSGILHEAHHHAYNALPGVRAYSMYPSRRQRFRDEDVRVFRARPRHPDLRVGVAGQQLPLALHERGRGRAPTGSG